MKLNRKWILVLSLVLSVAMATTGTLAYLSDTATDVNVMTLGSVKIEQHEYERVVNDDGTYKTDTIDDRTSYVLQSFSQGKPLMPIVGDPNEPGNSPAYAGYDEIPVRMSQVDSYGGMDVFAGKNAQDKFVTVENTGRSDAYVRTFVAFEIGTASPSLIGSSYHKTWKKTNIGNITLDGNAYHVVEYLYTGARLDDGSWRHENGILPAGDTTYPNLSQVYLKSKTTNEDIEAIDGNKNGMLDILVLSQAVQADGFEDAQTALDTAFGKPSENVDEWFGGMMPVLFVEAYEEKDQRMGEDVADILAALKNGTNLIVDKNMDLLGFDTNEVDAKGATVSMNGVGPEAYGYLAFLPDAGEDVTVSNLNVTGSGFVEVGHYGQGGGKYTLNNVSIKDLAATLNNADKGINLGCAFMAFGDAELNDCTMKGATAVQSAVLPVDLGCGQGLTTKINNGEYGTVYCWSHANVTIDGAEVDTLYTAPIKGSVTIKAGTHVGTIQIDYGTASSYATKDRLQKLVIEDGATVNQIVFNGTSYTMAQWKEYVNSL